MRRISGLTILVFILAAAAALAAEVETDVSTRETYVGLPIVLRFHIHNAARHEAPEMPEVDGLVIQSAGPPSRSSRISIVNGQRSQRTTVTYSFLVTPQREGTFTIPPIKVVSDGYATISKVIRIVASKSDTDDLLFVEIEGKEQEIYVGQALDLTLKIWIRPYRDREFQVSLDEREMWSLIAKQTNWGAFEESLQQLAQDGKRPGGQSVLREDAEGNEREYFLYEIDATVYPDRPGQIDGDDVRIIMKYPVQLSRPRSPFSMFDDDDIFGGSGLFGDSLLGPRNPIKKSRPIVAQASVEPIIVKPIPSQGRPENYRGAVGNYTIITEAKPTRVKVGDPITLHIGIDGTGAMDVVRAPPLASQKTLTRDFKVPDEPLAGFVDGSRKIFSTTIRPLHDGVTEIPPVPMSYFDPKTEKFVTVTSDPIPIQVEPADVLALDAIVGGRQPSTRSGSSGEQASPSEPTAELALFTGPELLRSVDRPSLISSRLLGMLIIPPLVTLAVLAFASRHLVSGLVSARRQFRKAVTLAQSPAEIAEALERFLARQFRLGEGHLTRDQTIGQLRASGHHDLAIRVERLYANCQKPISGARSEHSTESLKDEALRIVSDFGRAKRAGRSRQAIRKLSSTTGLFFIAALTMNHSVIAESTPAAEPDQTAVTLSPDQQTVMLDEAASIYSSASTQSDNAVAKEQFARSASKFQLLVDSGIRNDRLYCNLAGAQIRAGQTGRAIANYRRALRLAPASGQYREQLALAEKTVQVDDTLSPGLASLRELNDVLLRFIPPHVMQGLFVSAWAAFWCILVLRLLRFPFHWKSAALLTFLCAALTAGSYLLRVSEFVRDEMAVLVEPTVSLREGDGPEFAEIGQLTGAEGRVVRVLDHRGDWTRIGLGGGRTGWISASASEEI